MAKMIYALAGQNIIYNFPDGIVRTVQEVIFGQLASQPTLYFQAPGFTDSGQDVHTTILIGRSSALAFQYDTAVLPSVDEDLQGKLNLYAKLFGGISLGGSGIIPEDAFASLESELEPGESVVLKD